MGIRNDISKIPKLQNMGLALIDYIVSLSPNISFEQKGRRWVPSENFVTFTIQHARSENIVISLRGNPKEFIQFEELPLKEGMGHGAYSECIINNPKQLPAIALCIKKAYELYCEGGSRQKKKPIIIE